MFFNDDKEEILEKVADILATCKHKLDHKECTLEKCNNCSFGYVLQFSKKYMSEMELDYIKMLSQLQYENTEYTTDNDDENDDSDEDNDEKKQDERDSAMGTLTLGLIVAGLICLIIYGMCTSL